MINNEFINDLKELRSRVLIAVICLLSFTIVSFYFSNNIFNVLTVPVMDALEQNSVKSFMYTALHEKFMVDIKIAFYSGFILSLPIFLHQIWKFITPGLFENEKNIVRFMFVLSPFLFFISILFVYYYVLPIVVDFFLNFEQKSGVEQFAIVLEPKVNEYLSLVMKLIFAFGISFQLPILLLLLIIANVINIEFLKSKRRYAIVIAFVIAAILTPPDPLSQIILAIPLILLYEISIIIGNIIKKER